MPSPEELDAYDEWLRRTGVGVTLPDAGPATAAAEGLTSPPAAAPRTIADYEEWQRRQGQPKPATEVAPQPRATQTPDPFGLRQFNPEALPYETQPSRYLTPDQGVPRAGFYPAAPRSYAELSQLERPRLVRSALRTVSPLVGELPPGEAPLTGAEAALGSLAYFGQLLPGGEVASAARKGVQAAREAVPLASPVGKALAASSEEVDAASARFELLSGQFEQASQRLDEAKAELEATLARGRPAPKFGTAERAEFDVERRGKVSKAEQVRRARVNLRTVREETAGIQRDMEEANAELDRVLMEPVTEPIAPESRLVPPSTEPTPTAGAVQAGMGIGERPPQGILGLGGEIEARPSKPLIDAEQVGERQRLTAERAAGQAQMALRETPPPPAAAPLVPPPGGAGGIVGTATSDLPPSGPVTPSDMQRIIEQAKGTVRQDRPGMVSDILQKVPGLKQARAFERPGLAMTGENENVLIAHVAENLAQADVRAQVTASRVAIDRELVAAFGRKVVQGDEAAIKFLGTSEQAASPLTHTLVDIAENPELYDLTTAQKTALSNLEQRNTELLQSVKTGYGPDIGQYPAKPGGAFLTHIDVPDPLDVPGFSQETARVGAGQAKERFYQTARERLEGDPTYKPELNVTRLLDSMDRFKVRAAAGETFRKAVGGLTRSEVMQQTHPNLFNKMTTLNERLQGLLSSQRTLDANLRQSIDGFMASPKEPDDLVTLQDAFDAVLRAGPRRGQGRSQIYAQLNQVKGDIADLRPAWKAANLKPYAFVQEGIYRYFPPEQAALIGELRKMSTNRALAVLNEIRGGAFSGDLSPFLGVQTPLGVIANPIGSSKMAAGAIIKAVKDKNLLRSFSTRALAEDMASDPAWREYSSFIGRAPSAAPSEFSSGYLTRIPGAGSLIGKFTESSYVVVTRQAKGLWESTADSLIKSGVPDVDAKVAAAAISSEVFPSVSAARLGQSPARAGLIGAVPTSYSFIRQPASLIAQATRGYVKLGLLQTLTPQERLATQIATTMAASVMSASVVSAVLSAEATGRDTAQAALDAVNPDPKNGRFASLVFGDLRVPLGGPYRALFRAIYPSEVKGVPVPVPFARIPQFAQNRLNPAIATQLRLYKNKDFYGRTIREGTFQEQLLQSLLYEMQGVAPLTIGTAVEGARGIASGEEIATQTIGQFAGANVAPVENPRQTAAKYELAGTLPPPGTSLTILRTAYKQAGEGRLSDDALKAWNEYEPLPDARRKVLLQTLTPEIRTEIRGVGIYREMRRERLATAFPELDVLLVEEAWRDKRPYTPKTKAGRERENELANEEYGAGLRRFTQPRRRNRVLHGP